MKAKSISEINKARYEKKFEDKLSYASKRGYSLLYDAIKGEVEKKGDKLRYLDIGPRGNFLKKVADDFSINTLGLDQSDRLADYLKKKGIKMIKADLQKKIPVKDGSLDIISGLLVIEHLVDPEFFIKEMRRILKKDGLLILSTPNMNSLGSRLRILFGRLPLEYGSVYSMRWGHHVRLFNKGIFRKLFEKNGFRVERLTGTEVYLHPNRNVEGLHSKFLGRLFPCLAQKLFIVGRKR